MPLSTSAKKALRKDRRRTVVNNIVRSKMRTAIRTLRQEKTAEALIEVYSTLDRAAKRNVIHRKKAARLKSRLSKVVDSKVVPTAKKQSSEVKKDSKSKTVKKKASTKSTATAAKKSKKL